MFTNIDSRVIDYKCPSKPSKMIVNHTCEELNVDGEMWALPHV